MKSCTIETRRGARCRVLEGGSGEPLVFLHGAGGLLAENPFLDRLAGRYHVLAPELPGYGSNGEELLDDMLDFALHGWDVVDALGLARPHLVGHSMGGMIAAEMACLAPRDLAKLVLVDAAGLWLDDHPIPDLFSLLPFQFAELLFHDPERGAACSRAASISATWTRCATSTSAMPAAWAWPARSSSRSPTATWRAGSIA